MSKIHFLYCTCVRETMYDFGDTCGVACGDVRRVYVRVQVHQYV